MATPRCSGCRFFVVLEGQRVLSDGLVVPSEPHWGECRAQPPLAPFRDGDGLRPRIAATWPLVHCRHWCGAWEEKSGSDG